MTVIEEGLVAKIRKSEHRDTQSKHYIEGKDFQFKKIMFPIEARIWELTELFDEPHGANFMEVLACSKYMNIDEAIVSATLDKAIDCGHVFAKQAEVNYERDVKRITRIFCPEGEYVSSYIRRLVAMQ